MHTLQNDNSSLMRRLNLVLQELDRIKQEKMELTAQLGDAAKHTENVQDCIRNEDNMDKVNKFMQDDLKYERDRNLGLQDKIKETELNSNYLVQ